MIGKCVVPPLTCVYAEMGQFRLDFFVTRYSSLIRLTARLHVLLPVFYRNLVSSLILRPIESLHRTFTRAFTGLLYRNLIDSNIRKIE